MSAALFDHRTRPSLRDRIGHRLARSRAADFAVARIRLAELDLRPAELQGIERCRLLVAVLDARTFAQLDEAAARPGFRIRLNGLRDFARSGRVAVRISRTGWEPDFSLYRAAASDPPSALFGSHTFVPPYPNFGLGVTCSVTDAPSIGMLHRRFDELWREGRDGLGLIMEHLDRALDRR